LVAAVFAAVTSSAVANTTETWSPAPSGPYGFNFSTLAPENGNFFASSSGSSLYTFDFGDGPNAATHAGLVSDTYSMNGGYLVTTGTWAYVFTANNYTLRSTTESIDYSFGATFNVASNVSALFSMNALGNLTKIGNGTLVLDQPFINSVMTVSAGTLQFATSSLLANDTVSTALNTVLAFGNTTQSTASLTNGGSVTGSGGNLTFTSLTNSGNMTLAGGELVATNYLGNGSLSTSPTSAMSYDGDTTVGGLDSSGNITLNGTFLTAGVNAGQIDTFYGNLSGNGSFFKIGTSELILLGNTSLTGTRGAADMTVEGGTLAGNTNNLVGTIDVLGNTMLIFAQASNGTFNGALSGNGTVLLSGQTAGLILTFATSSPFTGNLQVQTNLILAASSDDQLGVYQTVVNKIKTSTYATFTFNGGTLQTTAALTSPRSFVVTQNGGTLDTHGVASTFTGSFTSTGNGTLNMTGGGTVTLSNNSASLYAMAVASANLTLSGATLNVASAGTGLGLNTGNVTLINSANVTAVGMVSLLGNSTLTVNRSTLVSGAATVGRGAGIVDSVSLVGFGSLWTVNGNLDAGKDQVGGIVASPAGVGSISLGVDTSLSVSGTTTLYSNSTVSAPYATFTTGALASSTSAASVRIADYVLSPVSPSLIIGSGSAANATYSGTIADNGGPGSIHKIGGNTQTLSGVDTYSGQTLIDGGTLVIGSATAIPASSLITNNATLSIASATVSAAAISGNGTLSVGAGDRLTLTGASASKQDALLLGNAAILDIGAHALILEATAGGGNKFALIAQAVQEIASAKAANGGITSSTVNGNPSHLAIAVADNAALATPFTTFDGQDVDANSVLITPALVGDATLDGKVDLSDLNVVLNHLGVAENSWTVGDFDGAATVDLTDLNDVLNALGTSISGSSVVASTAAVPEPASLLIALPLVALFMARRKTVVAAA
jgi:autotransporter-associated beta strand protein